MASKPSTADNRTEAKQQANDEPLNKLLKDIEKDAAKVSRDFAQTVDALKDMNAQLEAVSVKHMEVVVQSSQALASTASNVTSKSRSFVERICKLTQDLEKISDLERKIKTTRSALSMLERLVDKRAGMPSTRNSGSGASSPRKS
uniref:BLOC-1-related complex subunit 6 C-terminal helix domain-containing protein n=1 Tax=Lotharella oceanica TaxID=641309 RepID=A0A7S2X5P5_9EUKA|eukprot:CAMPEP_0170167468 /NCGR_PEP_ID=MMETSP0040_2-20121228/870_1 /TAXON_ID=641309 /ORGANISM="Lotharella oceanica, Strain CCMP622" /LENGTH=144 /DNA_ID=CAMNT_0010405505 /DNA_START=14 /DNA_END=448 /DNA_ORIENTATION=+